MERKWLIQIRCEKGFTQEQVASLTGIDRTTYTRYERGTRCPNPVIASKIASVLGFEAGYFFWPERAELTRGPGPAA